MIRINLLASAADRPAVAGASWPAWTTALGGPAIVLAVLVLPAWWFWALRAETAETSRALADAEATLRSLAPAAAGVRDAEAELAALGRRVALIAALQARRGTAVRMLDRLSRAVPDGLWFGEVREETDGFVVRGYAAALATVSDYAAALDAAGGFEAPVEIVDSQRGERSGGREIVSFEIRTSFPAPAGGR